MGRRQDRALEQAGLLNYQTKGMSQAEIQQRYMNAGINVNEGWFKQNYAGNPQAQVQQQPAPAQFGNLQGGTRQQGQDPRRADVNKFDPYKGIAPTNAYGGAPTPDFKDKLRAEIAPALTYESTATRRLGYVPTFGQDPREIAKAYQQLQSTPAEQMPEWMAAQSEQIKQAYDWFSFRNGNKPWTEWKFLDQTDPAMQFLGGIQGPPQQTQPVFASNEQAMQGQANWTDIDPTTRQNILSDPNFDIAQYPGWQQQQILADPGFNWDGLPAWQRLYYSLSSNPAAMGAAQGFVMGAGNPGGAVAGGVLGYGAAKSGYDQNKEFWQQENKVAGAFGLMNWFAEQAEKGIGAGVQAAGMATGNNDLTAQELFTKETWNAGTVTFESLAPAYQAAVKGDGQFQMNDLLKAVPTIWIASRIVDLVFNPDEYKGEEILLGRADPLGLESTFYERINEARTRIANGENYREVATDLQTGVMAQLGDMVGQGVADPLNVLGETTSKVGETIAKAQGNDVAAAAFAGSSGPVDAIRKYQNLINNPAEALKIDPNFKVDELTWLGRTVAGLTSDGKIKAGLFDTSGDLLNAQTPKGNVAGFIDSMTSLTPESRARVGQDLLIRNLGGIMSSYFQGADVSGFAGWWRSFSKGDMTVNADLSKTMANSPEFYTVMPAAKDFNIDGLLSAWEISEPRRQDVSRLADILGENPMTLIEDLNKRGTAAEDFARIQERLQQTGTPEAQALLKDIADGKFTEASLAEAVKVFGDGSVPYHPGQWMAMTLDAIKTHYDEWAVDHFKLDEESRKTLFRMSSVMKSAQSILLLGANPGYMISNVLPTMVTRAASGVWGYMTPTAIDGFMSRMGFNLDEGFQPNRLDEGVGPAGLIDQASGRKAGGPDLIREATRGKGWLTNIENAVGKVGRAMPFNKLSRILEGYEGKQAFVIGIKKFWGEAWTRGKGFREIPAGLISELQKTAGPRAADILYSAIESGMTQQELSNIVNSRNADVQSRSLINQAAKDLNIPASKASAMMEQAGILDALDAHLKGARTEGKVKSAFDRARKTAQEAIDAQAGRDTVARAEHIANRLNTEGTKALTDIVLDTEMQGIEKWIQHYENMGAVADAMDSIDNADARSRLWSSAYAEDMATYRRYSAQRGSTYLGVLKAIGLDTTDAGRGWLATIADTDGTIDRAYATMRELRDTHFRDWNGDWNNPRQQVERTRIESQIDKVWKDATKREVDNLKKMGDLLAEQYESLFGVEAGEAARQAWEQITDFRKEMVKRRDDFRKTLQGVPNPQRQIMSKEFWQKNYTYMIVEMSRIKQDAIARLDRIANKRGGGDPTGNPVAPDPTPDMPPAGTGSAQTNVNAEMEQLRQAAQERAKIEKAKTEALWDVAEQYSKMLAGNSSRFDRGYLQDRSHLMNTLKSEQYGGDPTITTWKDAAEKLTPERVKEILEARQQIKETTIQAEEAARQARFISEMEKAKAQAETRKTPENLTILQNIRKRGGIDKASWINFADNPEGFQPGVFTVAKKNRWGLDQMARLLAEDGYPIDINDPADIGGINQTIELIRRARAGEDIYPVGHEYVIDAEVNKAQADYLANDLAANELDLDGWELDMADAIDQADGNRMIDLYERVLAEDMGSQTRTGLDETYEQYFSRAYDEMTARLQQDEQSIAIAENTVRAEQAVKAQQAAGETAMTRQRFRESLTDVFNLTDEMAEAVMDITDARANAYGNVDEWYASRIADVVKAGDGIDLAQEAYHGSPYKFDQFTLDHMGSGEGAQAYGWGLYFAGDKSVAEWYRNKLSNGGRPEWKFKGQVLDYGTPEYYAAQLVGEVGLKDARLEISSWIEDANASKSNIEEFTRQLAFLDQAESSNDFESGRGQLYKVEIPDENYLLWDKPLSEQPQAVKDALANVGYEIYKSGEFEAVRKDGAYYDNGQSIYKLLEQENGSPKAASLALKEAGINGIQYLDGSSRGKGEGNYNFVIFDDAAIQIKETYYQADAQGVGADGSTTPRTAKGGVQFLEDGKAIIRAFEKADVSTVVHEIGHIFRRDLQGTDLTIIENWAGVKNGEWTVAAEEKFARGFERYLADGTAPTPKLRKVFAAFKSWMTNIYRAITGSPIDIELNPSVKEVFDRLLIGERERSVDVSAMLLQMGYDPKTTYMDVDGRIRRRPEINIKVDRAAAAADADTVLTQTFNEQLKKVQASRITNENPAVDANVSAPRKGTPIWKMTEREYTASLFADQKAKAERTITNLQREIADLQGSTETWVDATRADLQERLRKAETMRDRNTVSYQMYGDTRVKYMEAIKQALENGEAVSPEIRAAYDNMGTALGQLSSREANSLRDMGKMLFQEAEPTDTPEFKNWFGDSKVVDENGRPLVVYHGTGADITEFDLRKANDLEGRRRGLGLGKGKIYLDGEKAVASAYAENAPRRRLGKAPNVMPLYVKIENPISLSDYHLRFKDLIGKEIYDSTLTMKERDAAIAKLDNTIRAEGYDGIVEFHSDKTFGQIAAFDPTQIKSTANQGTFDPNNPNILFQSADPRMPLGGYEESAGWLPHSEVMDEGWTREIQPLLNRMQETAISRLNEPAMDGAYKDMSPEGQKMLSQYLNGVKQDMASTKLAAQRWGADQRDFTMLNYNKRYGFDKWMDVVYPYQFFYTRSMMTWAARAIDHPAWLSNYARLRMQQDRYENNLPERLRGKMRIEAPWMPDWMGDALYIDPLSVLFTPHNFLRPFEQLTKDQNMQSIEAERILQEWAAEGSIPQDQIQQAVQTRSGSVYERALAEAKIRRESEISNPMDFVSAMFGPAWYLTTPYKLATGKGKEIGELPITKTARAIDTVTQGTWAEPVGDILGLIAKPEEKIREKLNLPTMGEYGDYYTDRQIANMVAEGLITSEQAQIAMIERQGDIFTQAQERVKLELAMRVPLAGTIYAGLHEGAGAAAQAFLPSMFGAGLLPEGELIFRGLKDEWNAAWKMKDAGDDQAITRFFEEHPEYEAYLAKGKPPEDRLRSFLIGQIWDGYMSLGETDRKQATAAMGDLFKQAFLNSETRSYDTLDVKTLTTWAQMVDMLVPNVEQTAPAIGNAPQVQYYPQEVTAITDRFFTERKELYPNYYMLEQGYYSLPKSDRAEYLLKFPQLQEYWKWKDGYYNRFPELMPIFKGQVFKQIDTAAWPIGLESYITDYAYAGTRLPRGARKALEQVWIREGMPMGDMDTWLNTQVVPALLYQQGIEVE